MRKTDFSLVVALLLTVGLSGCMLRGPSGLKDQVSASSGRTYDREFGMTLGRTSMALTRWGAGISGHQEVRRALKGVRKVQIGVYEVVDEGTPGRTPLASDFKGWDPLVQVREDGETVLILTQVKNDHLNNMLLVVDSSGELVLVRLRGNLDRIVEDAIRFGLEEVDREDLVDPVLEEYRGESQEPEILFL